MKEFNYRGEFRLYYRYVGSIAVQPKRLICFPKWSVSDVRVMYLPWYIIYEDELKKITILRR